MFYKNIFNKNISTKAIKLPSIKQLYIIYTFLNKTRIKNNAIKPVFYHAVFYIMLVNFNYLYRIAFLTLVFFFKTACTFYVFSVKRNIYLFNNKNLFSTFVNNDVKVNIFWKKWKTLKRPNTDSDAHTYYIDDFKRKLNLYVALGFVGVYNTFVLVKSKTNDLSNFAVSFNRSLLLAPKYSSSTIHKHLSISDSNDFEFQFLRKNKVYNKGRYSRTRQNYRTGVYLCMYLSVLSIFGLYYWFYKFSFNFTYLWWVFIAFVGSFFFPKIVKYRLYEPTTLFSKIFGVFKWGSLLVKSLFF